MKKKIITAFLAATVVAVSFGFTATYAAEDNSKATQPLTAYAADSQQTAEYTDDNNGDDSDLPELKAPTVTYASSPESGYITASWTEVSGADGYQVNYCSNTQFSGGKTASVTAPATSATFSDCLIVGRTYYIRARAYVIDESENKIYGEWSNVYTYQLMPKTPRITSVFSPMSKYISASWIGDSKAYGYQVNYCSNTQFTGGKVVNVSSPSTTNATFNDCLIVGRTYYIRVRAYGKALDGSRVYGDWSNVYTFQLTPKKLSITSISSPKSGYISTSWAKDANVSGYQVSYCSNTQFTGGLTVTVSSPSTASTTFSKGLVVGRTYYIRVRAYGKDLSGNKVYGDWSNVSTYQLKPQTPSISSVFSPETRKITASWSRDANVSGYQVNYCSNTQFTGGLTVTVSSPSTASTTFSKGLVVGRTYYIRVRAYGKDLSGNKVYGSWSPVKSIKCMQVTQITALTGSVIKDKAAWSGKTLATFNKGAKLGKIETSGNWIKVSYNGTVGYIYNKAITGKANYSSITTSTLPTVADDWLFDNGTDIKTIFDYAYHMYYSSSAKEGSIEEMCVQVFKTRTGACYHHAAIMKYLLERAGYDVYYVVGKSFTTSEHRWNLVKTSAGWRHYDATPFIGHDPMYNATDSQAPSYLSWDRSKYPAAK